MTYYKLADSPYTHGMYVIKYRKWWFPFYRAYGTFEYKWPDVIREINRLRAIEDINL